MLASRRAAGLLIVVAFVAASASVGATGIIVLPYWKDNATVSIGSTVVTKCTGDVNTISSCQGASCAVVGSYACLPFTCAADGLGCTATCVTDSNCGQGAACNKITGQCASYDSMCSDPYTMQSPAGQLFSCSPYRCLAGRCQQQCSVDLGDCAPGFKCQRGASTGRYNCYPVGR